MASQNFNNALGNLEIATRTTGVRKDLSVAQYLGELIQATLTFVGIIFFILTIYAGFRWMLARGDQGAADSAKKTLTAASVGLIIIVAAYAATSFIFGVLN
jgi:cbb3-type cytochrome oxidase subunit 3